MRRFMQHDTSLMEDIAGLTLHVSVTTENTQCFQCGCCMAVTQQVPCEAVLVPAGVYTLVVT